MSDQVCQYYISFIEKINDPIVFIATVSMFGGTFIILIFGFIHSCWCSYPSLRPIRLLYPNDEKYKQVPPTVQPSEYISSTGYPPLPDILSIDMLSESDYDDGEICETMKSESSSVAGKVSSERKYSAYSQGSKSLNILSNEIINIDKIANEIDSNRTPATKHMDHVYTARSFTSQSIEMYSMNPQVDNNCDHLHVSHEIDDKLV